MNKRIGSTKQISKDNSGVQRRTAVNNLA